MSEDTKRALEIIKPMADSFSINVSADDRFLYCNGQAIGISCNSTYATVMEFLGYVLVKEYGKRHRLSDKVIREAKQYWVSPALMKKIQAEGSEE